MNWDAQNLESAERHLDTSHGAVNRRGCRRNNFEEHTTHCLFGPGGLGWCAARLHGSIMADSPPPRYRANLVFAPREIL
jgi:hypothetical protein